MILAFLLLINNVHAMPLCLDGQGNELAISNEYVIGLKSSTPNGYLSRARVKGPISRTYPSTPGHIRFGIMLSDTVGLEVVYNNGFGKLPPLTPGTIVEACGDYITSNKDAQYPASPEGAIIHWVHRTNGAHPGGYLIIGGQVCGQSSGKGFDFRGGP